jgi:hypothetical protein
LIGATDHWTDETNRLLPVAEALLHVLADAFTPVQVPQGFEMILYRVPDGWIVGAFNNRPELKIVAGASVLDSGASECLIRWKKGAPQRFMPQLGDFSWNNTVRGLTTMLRPGEAAVVRVTMPQ